MKYTKKNKLPVTNILEDSIVKDVKGWKLSDKKDKTLNITVEQKRKT